MQNDFWNFKINLITNSNLTYGFGDFMKECEFLYLVKRPRNRIKRKYLASM
jgi:hypothetical protein